jgi:hypothetical protein
MKAQELRIGNLVKTPRGIKSINGLGFKDTVVSSKDYYATFNNLHEGYFLDHCEPIPLTEEILLKAGFVSGGAKQWLFITLDKKDECYLYFNPLGKGIAIDQNGIECSFEIELNYLHQLQNLYFALTNEELTINL